VFIMCTLNYPEGVFCTQFLICPRNHVIYQPGYRYLNGLTVNTSIGVG